MDPVVNSIIREARGNAFLLEQLARYASTSDQAATTASVWCDAHRAPA